MSTQTQCSVLIVDDNEQAAEIVEKLLVKQGYEVVGIATDGASAVEAVLDLRPDVVIMDMVMPVMDGIEATRQIKKLRPTPVVMLTSYDTHERAAAAAAAGIHAYVMKPASPLDLARAIIIARANFEKSHPAG